MDRMRDRRVLLVASDHIFEDLEGVEVEFVGGFGREMGRSMIAQRGANLLLIFKIAAKLLLRRYDRVVLPSVLLPYMAKFDPSTVRRLLAEWLEAGSYHPAVTRAGRFFSRLLFGKGRISFIDRIECVHLYRPFFTYFDPALVFKTNVWRKPVQRTPFQVIPVPFWINADSYPEEGGKEFEDRQRGVFFAGAMCSRQRRLAPEVEKLALEAGIDFFWPRERIPFEEFLDCLRDCKIAWSPEGSIWNCWRHYEALLFGAIPLINRPDPRIYHELVDGEHCFFYDDPAHAVELMGRVVTGDLRLSLSAAERRAFVLKNYSAHAAGRRIASRLDLTAGAGS